MTLEEQIAALPFNPGVDSVYTYPDRLAYERARLALTRRALQTVLDTRDVEAQAELEMRRARRSYHSADDYEKAWTDACVATSKAEADARRVLEVTK